MEIWKPVKNFEDFYEVSNLGNIKSIERTITLPSHSYLKKEKILRIHEDGRGYQHVKLYDGKGNPKSLTVHRIVATTFIENPKMLIEVNHIDGNKLNNNVNNLEWSTRTDNIKHAYLFREDSTYKGSGNKNSKLIESQVIEIRKRQLQENINYKKLAKEYNVSTTLIGYIINKKVWTHV